MNTGIGDAVNLAWKLAAVLHGKANASILEPEIRNNSSLVAHGHFVKESVGGGNGTGRRYFRQTS